MRIWQSLTVSGFVVAGLAAMGTASAHPRAVTPAQLQRLSADLTRSDTQDFFRVGRIKLEREVQTIYDRRSQLNIDVLIINPSIQPQPDLSPLETPNLERSQPPKR